MCLSLIMTALWSPRYPILTQQKLGIYKFLIQAVAPKFVLSLKATALKLEGLSFGIRPSIYVLKGCFDEPAPKSTHKCDF